MLLFWNTWDGFGPGRAKVPGKTLPGEFVHRSNCLVVRAYRDYPPSAAHRGCAPFRVSPDASGDTRLPPTSIFTPHHRRRRPPVRPPPPRDAASAPARQRLGAHSSPSPRPTNPRQKETHQGAHHPGGAAARRAISRAERKRGCGSKRTDEEYVELCFLIVWN